MSAYGSSFFKLFIVASEMDYSTTNYSEKAASYIGFKQLCFKKAGV